MAADTFEIRDDSLTLITLGAARLDAQSGQDLRILTGPGKPLALLAYLSASPGRSATREHLIDLLWSDVDSDAGRHGLRQMVWYIRQRVGESVLTATRESISLTAAVTTD